MPLEKGLPLPGSEELRMTAASLEAMRARAREFPEGEEMSLTLAQDRERRTDRGQTYRIKGVDHDQDWFGISTEESIGFWLGTEHGVVPKAGDLVTLYTHQGSMIHGVDLNGEPVFYRTRAEQEEERLRAKADAERKLDEEFEAEREQRDAAYDALPDIFKRRIAWFRAHNPRFRQDFEPYEMASCNDAVKLAAWAEEQEDPAEAIRRFQGLNWEEQKETVPDLDYGRHSGNSFGFAVRLAFHYVTEPENVYQEHGAMVPLVGCEEYGCWHPREALT